MIHVHHDQIEFTPLTSPKRKGGDSGWSLTGRSFTFSATKQNSYHEHHPKLVLAGRVVIQLGCPHVHDCKNDQLPDNLGMKIIRGAELEFTPASHEDPNDPGCLKRVLATKSDLLVGTVQMVNWSKLPVGKSFQLHYHEDMQEVFVMIDGTVTMLVDGKEHRLSGGDCILIDPREVHNMTNTCDRDVIYLVFGISTQQGGKTVVVE